MLPSLLPNGLILASMAGVNVSQSCQSAVSHLLTPEVSTCFNVPGLVKLYQTEDSIIPPFNEYLSTFCHTPACSENTLTWLAGNITQGCGAEFEAYGIPKDIAYQVISVLPVVREVICLKTTDPESADFANASIPIDNFVTSTGAYCITDLLTEVAAYWGVDLTWINALINVVAEVYYPELPGDFLCQDCVYGALDIIDDAYPNATKAEISIFGETFSIDGYLGKTCAADGFTGTTQDGTLPDSIHQGATTQVASCDIPYPTSSSADAASTSKAAKRAARFLKEFHRP